MKRLLSIFALCLLSAAALFAQQTYTLTVRTMPQAMADIIVHYVTDNDRTDSSQPSMKIPVGSHVEANVIDNSIKASSWKVTEWRVTKGNVSVNIDKNLRVSFTMPAEDVSLVAIMEFCPDNPDNPQTNAWYPDEGKLVIDNFRGGGVRDLTSTLIPDANDYGLVRSFVAGGYVTSQIVYDLHLFTQLTYVDLSRLNFMNPWTGDVTFDIDNTRYNNLPWKELLLPANIDYIGYHAFEGTELDKLTIYTTTPPRMSTVRVLNEETNVVEVKQDAFPSCPNMTVYVPAESLPLYTVADGWKEFDLKPIIDDCASLTVNIDAGKQLSDYYGLTLEVQNTKSLYARSAIVTGRTAYNFSALPKQTSYDVRLLSRTGAIIAKQENVRVGDEDISITLDNLKSLQKLNLQVTDGTAPVDADRYTCLWTDMQGRLLNRNSSISGIVVDEPVQAVVSLVDEALKETYVARDTVVINEPGSYASGIVNYQLRSIPTHRLTTIVNRADGTFLRGATARQNIYRITAQGSELLRQQTFSKLTPQGGLSGGQDEPLPEGTYDVTVSIEGTNLSTVTQRVSLYADQTLSFSLSEAKGSTVNVKWMHYGVAPAGIDADGVEPTMRQVTQAAITLRNLTDGTDLKGFAIGPTGIIRLQEQLTPGTEVELTLGNRDGGNFNPVTMRQKADQDGNLSFNVSTRENGSLLVSFTQTECSKVSVRLYNMSGQLIKATNAPSTNILFDQLKDGVYSVVLMEGGDKANAMNSMEDLQQFYLESVDYVVQPVNISSGQTSVASFQTVPHISTMLRSYFSEARVMGKNSQVNVGSLQTISMRPNVLPEYEGRISQLKAVFTLPDEEECHFVGGSVLMNNNQTDYTYEDGKLTVPFLAGQQLRYCLVPLTTGTYAPAGKLTFLLDGEPCQQSLQATTYSVTGVSLSVTPVSSAKEVLVRGSAIARTPVTVFCNDEEVGSVVSGSDGFWNIMCPLVNTYNMGENTFYAQYNSSDGFTLKSSKERVVYDRAAIRPLSVRMSYYNPELVANQIVDFDLERGTFNPSYYVFYYPSGMSDFNFSVQLSTTDTTYVDDVILYVYCGEKQRRVLYPKFNKETGTWMATDAFDMYNLPTQVAVRLRVRTPKVLGDEVVSDYVHVLDNIYDEYLAEDTVLTALKETAENSPQGSNEQQEALREIIINSGINPDNVMGGDTCGDSEAELQQWDAQADAAIAALDEAFAEYDKLQADGFFDIDPTPFNELGEVLKGFKFSKMSSSARRYYAARARGESPAPLPAAGPNENEYVIDLESGGHIYYRLHDNGYVMVIPDEDLQVEVDYTAMDASNSAPLRELRDAMRELSSLQSKAPYRASDDGFIGQINATIDKVITALNRLSSEIDLLIQYLSTAAEGGEQICGDVIKGIQAKTSEAWRIYYTANPIARINTARYKFLNKKGIEAVDKIQKLRDAQGLFEKMKGIKLLGPIMSAFSLYGDYNAFVESAEKLISLWYAIPDPCPLDQPGADAIRSSLKSWGTGRILQKGTAIVLDATSLASAIAGIVATIATGGAGVAAGGLGLGASLAISTVTYLGNWGCDKAWEYFLNRVQKDIDALKCDTVPCERRLVIGEDMDLAMGSSSTTSTGCSNCKKGSNASKDCPGPPPPPPPTVTTILDPSGFVYEAVGSNRVRDALASVYYKEIYEDDYGDQHERSVLWDAEPFDQVNPMLTDEHGDYGWDVPTGLWQVRVVKDGYLPVESQWLPVPPPQLDINLGMEQPTPPVIERVVASERGVQLRFDKYMKPQMLNGDNIFLTRGGQLLSGTITMCDAEPTPDSTATYVRTVLFTPQQSLQNGQTVRLTVRAGVESYANVAMLQDFSQDFSVEQRVTELIADSVVGILHGEELTLSIAARAVEAAKGKKVKVVSLDPTIAEVKTESIVLDQDGNGTLTINGKGYGTTALSMTLADDADVTTHTVVNVRDIDYMQAHKPKASLINGVEVTYGTLLRLTSDTPGAVIYYTLDGSCPCGNPDRLKYNGPIAIIGDMTLKAIAVAPSYTESDVSTFVYKLLRDPQGVTPTLSDSRQMPVYNMEGMKMNTNKPLRKGIYVQGNRKFVVR